MLFAPLEQFSIISFINIKFYIFDFSITNFLLINILLIINITFINFFINNKENMLFVSSYWQKFFELLLTIISQLITEIITKKNDNYLPILFTVFLYILFSNLIGLIPYTFTSTSHLIITFYLSFSIFLGINFLIIEKYNFVFFSLFLPSKTTFFLALVLVPIEFISYLAKPISLGVRLFINIMAGHTLLKVIINFSWNLLVFENLLSIFLIIPMIILIILFYLEFAVAFIQTYVFLILVCIYIQDAN